MLGHTGHIPILKPITSPTNLVLDPGEGMEKHWPLPQLFDASLRGPELVSRGN